MSRRNLPKKTRSVITGLILALAILSLKVLISISSWLDLFWRGFDPSGELTLSNRLNLSAARRI